MAFLDTAESQRGLVIDRAELELLASGSAPLTPLECMERAERAARALDVSALDRASAGDAVLLWRGEASEAWLNLWWRARDTGYHDHDGSRDASARQHRGGGAFDARRRIRGAVEVRDDRPADHG